ncbi:E3 ubiquitin-protein ligase [Sarotherodon galilaeus]
MLKLIMVLLWMILLVVLLRAEAENVTEVRGELGTNVTLTCSNQTADRYWYMEIHSQFRACIGRSFSSAATYCSPGFETKFSILGNKLVIKNFTAEDCRLYFCGIKRDDSIQFVETFCLVSAELLSNDSVLLWMLKLIMVLLWMILLVVLLCAEAKNVTEVRGELGTNVTLTCSKQTSDTHWYMEIHSQFRADVTIIDPQSDCRLNQLIIICVSVAVIVFVILGE